MLPNHVDRAHVPGLSALGAGVQTLHADPRSAKGNHNSSNGSDFGIARPLADPEHKFPHAAYRRDVSGKEGTYPLHKELESRKVSVRCDTISEDRSTGERQKFFCALGSSRTNPFPRLSAMKPIGNTYRSKNILSNSGAHDALRPLHQP